MSTRIKYGLIGVGFFALIQFFGAIAQYGWPN